MLPFYQRWLIFYHPSSNPCQQWPIWNVKVTTKYVTSYHEGVVKLTHLKFARIIRFITAPCYNFTLLVRCKTHMISKSSVALFPRTVIIIPLCCCYMFHYCSYFLTWLYCMPVCVRCLNYLMIPIALQPSDSFQNYWIILPLVFGYEYLSCFRVFRTHLFNVAYYPFCSSA
jgi:hypothetical protein